MYLKIIDKLRNKKVAIVGFGREGKSTYNFIRKYLPTQRLYILDKNVLLSKGNFEEDQNVSFILGDHYLDNLDYYDLIIKAPGISFKDIDISNIKDSITSEVNLLLEFFSNNVIGVTGTKGKSTTSSLLYKVLKDQGKDVYLCGNIGTPIFDYIDKIKEDTMLVVEMSAYHTEFITKAPHVGIILNLFPEHLDYFGTAEKYFNSKLNMFKKQNKTDFAIYSADNDTLNSCVVKSKVKSNLIKIVSTSSFSDVVEESVICDEKFVYYKKDNYLKRIYDLSDKRNLLGRHNVENIMFVLAVAYLFDLDMNMAASSINSFLPLEHRMEYVGKFKEILFYNDSIATIPRATINCLETLKNVDTLIVGGMDRNIEYEELITYLKNSSVRNIICLPDTGYKIGKMLENSKNVFFVDSIKEAVSLSYNVTLKNKSCLLSPAASSYNLYKNFEERGRDFKDMVKYFSSK